MTIKHRVSLLISLIVLPGIIAIVDSSSAAITDASTLQASVNTEQRAYEPPKRGVPGRREGAGTR